MTEKQNNVVILQNPIARKGGDVKEVAITGALKQAGSLRGLKVYDVMTSDVDTLLTLLPRVTSPALTKEELTAMDTWDFCQLSNAVATFLQPSSPASETGAVTA
ncbi:MULTISPECIES: phage tail assembly protein [Pectobacterium]|uniref:phage tail assembly protein n=1 Tax=Pectobacterium TaxID=122277 RepID=UPI000B26A96C|nr:MULTISPECIES: phage tail assembly protein [Pectobacterium]MBA0180322.1 phage tail assembly protein [Pectobacterium carotovorum]MBB1525690.1 phage tail assembly protein [Pectobacterium carotovorum subsp. carotovorum]MCA6964772.1 phage tail assembly protein [Pectobacterium carotovorum]MCA6974412.1 phage tail assembly protein [Pectobacterium carotovorum]MCH4987200.1 phage tail assembly protein [Pectobacterium carotovorum]